MKVKKNIAISDSGFIFNPTTGDSFSANPVGLEIIKLMKNGFNKDDIRNHLLSLYTVDEASFEKDYYDFVNLLVHHQIVEE